MSQGIEKIDDTVLRLSIPQPHYIPNNVYLLVCKSPTLIDAGHPATVSGDALKHAAQCRQSHAACQTDAEHFWNPYTQVDRLVTDLNEATRPHLRLQLD